MYNRNIIENDLCVSLSGYVCLYNGAKYEEHIPPILLYGAVPDLNCVLHTTKICGKFAVLCFAYTIICEFHHYNVQYKYILLSLSCLSYLR